MEGKMTDAVLPPNHDLSLEELVQYIETEYISQHVAATSVSQHFNSFLV